MESNHPGVGLPPPAGLKKIAEMTAFLDLELLPRFGLLDEIEP